MWSHESIYLPANASDEDGQGFNILQGGAEVDGAGTQQEHPTYDRVGEEGFPASLEAEKQFRV